MAEHLTMFTAGCGPLAIEAMEAAGHRLRLGWQDDSCLAFSTKGEVRPSDLAWAKNHFQVLGSVPRQGLPAAVRKLAAMVPGRLDLGAQHGLGFRVVVHLDGQLSSLDPRARQTLESALQRATRARVSPRGGGAEFWVLGRRDAPTLWLLRRTPKPNPGKPAKGALAPEFASLLCLASGPRPGDVFLDPFAGSGAIPGARAAWPAAAVLASDLEHVQWPQGRPPRGVRSLQGDVRELRLDRPVDVVVTDPPWGEYEDAEQVRELLAATPEALAALAEGAAQRLVLLINRRGAEAMSASLQAAGYRLTEPVEVLVNGHPASVLRGRLNAR